MYNLGTFSLFSILIKGLRPEHFTTSFHMDGAWYTKLFQHFLFLNKTLYLFHSAILTYFNCSGSGIVIQPMSCLKKRLNQEILVYFKYLKKQKYCRCLEIWNNKKKSKVYSAGHAASVVRNKVSLSDWCPFTRTEILVKSLCPETNAFIVTVCYTYAILSPVKFWGYIILLICLICNICWFILVSYLLIKLEFDCSPNQNRRWNKY